MAETEDRTFMQRAIRQAKEGNTPFGCVILRKGKVIGEAFNTVSSTHDPSAHGEINAIRAACLSRQTYQLDGATLYTTGEPCPMCMSAIIYAGIERVVYGAAVSTISRFMPQLMMTSSEVVARSSQNVIIEGPLMEEDCISLLEQFS